MNSVKKYLCLLFVFTCLNFGAVFSQKNECDNHITIYAMPSLYPLNWESPASLYNSMYSCYLKTILTSDNYLLGHLAVRIESKLLQEPIYMAMSSSNPKEKIEYVFKEKIGFAILGAAMQGRLETREEIQHKLEKYARRKKLAFISFRVNENAIKKMLDFIDVFSLKEGEKLPRSSYYGGAFWPRYYNEGAGCSAFALALLDVANILPSKANDWLIRRKIPMTLIGGKFNNNKKIKASLIRNTKEWYKESGRESVDYVSFQIYDPSVIYKWIRETMYTEKDNFKMAEEKGVPGLLVDCQNVPVSFDEPILQKRGDSNFFVEKHLEKLKKEE